MIKRLFIILLIALAIFLFDILYLREQPGFAAFNHGDTTLELPIVEFYYWVIATFVVLYFIFRLIGSLFRLPRRIKQNREHKRNLEIMQSLGSSMLEFSQFNWSNALKTATKHVKRSPMKKAQHLFAAHCAHNSGQIDTRNAHVASLRAADEDKSLANTIEAEFELEDGHAEKALVILHDESKDNICNVNTLSHAYIQTNNVAGLESTLAQLLPHSDKAARINYTVNRGLKWMINQYDINSSDDKLAGLWKIYHKQLKANPELLHSYVHTLIHHGRDTIAEQIIKTHLDETWDEILIQEYGLLKIDNIEQRTKQCEEWIKHHKESAGLLLTLGRLFKSQKLWGKAKSYLESSLSRRPLAATYSELADLHELLDEPIDAQRCAKKGLHIATREVV